MTKKRDCKIIECWGHFHEISKNPKIWIYLTLKTIKDKYKVRVDILTLQIKLYLLSSIVLVPYNLNFLILVLGPNLKKPWPKDFRARKSLEMWITVWICLQTIILNVSKRYVHTVSQKMLINRNIGKEPRYYGSPGRRRFICGDTSVKAVIKSLWQAWIPL